MLSSQLFAQYTKQQKQQQQTPIKIPEKKLIEFIHYEQNHFSPYVIRAKSNVKSTYNKENHLVVVIVVVIIIGLVVNAVVWEIEVEQ